jgi:hypothetical protein
LWLAAKQALCGRLLNTVIQAAPLSISGGKLRQ